MVKAHGHDTHDRVLAAVDPDPPAHDAGIAVETLLPEIVAEEGYRRRAGTILGLPDATAQHRLDAESGKKVVGDEGPLQAHGLPDAGEVEAQRLEGAHARHGGLPFLPLEVMISLDPVVVAHARAGFDVVPDVDQAIQVLDRQDSQEDRVDDGEVADVGRQQKRQGDHRGEGRGRAPGEYRGEKAARILNWIAGHGDASRLSQGTAPRASCAWRMKLRSMAHVIEERGAERIA